MCAFYELGLHAYLPTYRAQLDQCTHMSSWSIPFRAMHGRLQLIIASSLTMSHGAWRILANHQYRSYLYIRTIGSRFVSHTACIIIMRKCTLMHVPFCFLGCVHTVRIGQELPGLWSYWCNKLYCRTPVYSFPACRSAHLHQGCNLLVYCSGSLLVEPGGLLITSCWQEAFVTSVKFVI